MNYYYGEKSCGLFSGFWRRLITIQISVFLLSFFMNVMLQSQQNIFILSYEYKLVFFSAALYMLDKLSNDGISTCA